jgi:hypothetical protein
VVFRDHHLLANKPHAYVERIQLSGLCYMHAPVVLQHYLVSMHSDVAVPMIDMAAYMRQFLSPAALENRIWKDHGRDSKEFLRNILFSRDMTRFKTTNDFSKMEGSLRKYGPGLVQGFQVDVGFNSPQSVHIGPITVKSMGLHAMLLVGARQEGEEMRYLLQNWWKQKPFVEVDADYLDSCQPTIHFVKTAQTEIGQYMTNSHTHVECDLLDAPENMSALERI